jgi:soluble lytic murein transglycosylase
VDWVTWGTFEEPSEFVETIPFTETRDYVQAIMRNAAIYRQLYAGQPEPADDVKEAAQVKKPAGKTSSKKSVTRSHSRKTRSPRT